MRSLLVVALLVRVAAADPPGETRPLQRDTGDDKSLLTGYLLTVAAFSGSSLLGALGSESHQPAVRNVTGVLGTAGIILAPSVGHFYAGHYLTTGLVIRLVSVGGVVALGFDYDRRRDDGELIAGLILCLGVFETGMIWDLATLPRAIRKANREHAIYVAPITNGIALGGRF